MTYNPNIPNATDLLSNSQGQIKANFGKADTSFGTDHYAFSDATVNNGMHKWSEYVNQLSAPPNNASISSFYGSGTPGFANIYWKQEFGGADPTKNQGASVQMTGLAPLSAANGYTFLPGGLLLQWGTMAILANPNPQTITYAVPFTGSPYSINISKITADISSTGQEIRIITGSVTNINFQVRQSSSSSANSIYWMAIGVTS